MFSCRIFRIHIITFLHINSLIISLKIVGENLQSVEDFEAVLKWEPMRPVRVVSLVGLAEALLASARKHQEQFFMSNVKDACTQAIFCLIRCDLVLFLLNNVCIDT